MREQEVGVVDHWFGHISVAGVEVTHGPLKTGDKLHIRGHTSDFLTTVEAMELEHAHVDVAQTGDHVGIKVPEHVRLHDKVYKVVEE